MSNELSKAELVDLLQQTVSQLNAIVQQLNRGEITTLPPKVTVEQLLNSSAAIASLLKPTPVAPPIEPIIEELTPELATEEEVSEGLDQILPSFNRLETWWDGILGKMRQVLPTALSEKLSDWAITGILATGVVVVLLTSVLLFPPSNRETAPTVSELPSPRVIATPPELIAPEPPQRVEIAPPPEPELTPEQGLIAAIQQEVTDLTQQYPDGLIAPIEANFEASRLLVTLGDRWYQLNPKRQDAIGNAILKRSQKLDFRKLELVDPQGTLIARSPVIGHEIIILQGNQQLTKED